MATPAMDIAVSRNGKRVLNVWFAILVLFLYAPLGLLLLFSFNDNNLPVFPLRGFTPGLQDFAANTELRASVVTSAKVASIASLIAVLLGLLAAIVLVRRRIVGKSAASALLLSRSSFPTSRSPSACSSSTS